MSRKTPQRKKLRWVYVANRRRRKNLYTASTAGQSVSTEAQLRCKTTASNGNPTGPSKSATVGMSTADLRRPSSGSAISTSSIDAPSTFLNSSALDSHVPHMICKFLRYFPLPTSTLILCAVASPLDWLVAFFFGGATPFSAFSAAPGPLSSCTPQCLHARSHGNLTTVDGGMRGNRTNFR